jgi:hypothetical protein
LSEHLDFYRGGPILCSVGLTWALGTERDVKVDALFSQESYIYVTVPQCIHFHGIVTDKYCVLQSEIQRKSS